MMRRPTRAFTLVEILIVVIILGILAAIVLPQFWNVTTQASGANLADNLSKIRAMIQVYRNEHAAYPTGAQFVNQFMKATSFGGDVADTRDAVHCYGPYFEQMPNNPASGTKAIRSTSDPTAQFSPPATAGGWWYNEATGEFRADLPDSFVDEKATPFNQY